MLLSSVSKRVSVGSEMLSEVSQSSYDPFASENESSQNAKCYSMSSQGYNRSSDNRNVENDRLRQR